MVIEKIRNIVNVIYFKLLNARLACPGNCIIHVKHSHTVLPARIFAPSIFL